MADAIQFRGLPWKTLHLAYQKEVGKQYSVSYKVWKGTPRRRGCVHLALKELEATLPGAQPGLKLKRSARCAPPPHPVYSYMCLHVSRFACAPRCRHSNFPECTQCSQLRKAYLALASNSRASQAEVQAALQDMLDHREVWKKDREEALRLRCNAYQKNSGTGYQCDDKCGSFWLAMPVDSTGRESKENSQNRYHFAVQGNIFTGVGGICRLAIIPKNVTSGANFGLTNLMTVLLRKKQKDGGLPRKLIRHTDGGPDNVTWVAHLFHWLLVYLGIVDEVLWFRFDAGHSHTEIADRIFSCIKHLFETDGSARVEGCSDFDELEKKLQECLKDAKEELMVEWNFANFAFDKLFEDCCSAEFEGCAQMCSHVTRHHDTHLRHVHCPLTPHVPHLRGAGTQASMFSDTHTRVRSTNMDV